MKNKNKIKHVCFDLDGTLIDSFKTIYLATIFTLKELKIKQKIQESLFREKIGLHFVDIFQQMKIPVNNFEEFIVIYKRLYMNFIDDSKIYPNVIEVLNLLFAEDIYISLLTTKGQEQADRIIGHFDLTKYFSYIMGRRNDIPHKPSSAPLLFICKELNVKPENTLMVGDTELDILCGKNARTKTCAVTYGYRDENSLLKNNPDSVISDISKIPVIVQKLV
jgi:phosphoglycolate phosphatase/pyrophosphatase PpaX